METPKFSFKLSLAKGLLFNTIDWTDPEMQFPSPVRCMMCVNNLQTMIGENAIKFLSLPVEHRIVLLTDIIQKKKLVQSIFCQSDIEFLQLKLEIELENKKQEQLDAKELLLSLSNTELLAILGFHNIPAIGTVTEIGKKFGDFFFHTLNSKKDHMFDIKAVEIVKLICVLFVLQMGEAFNPKSMEGAVGEGRK